MNADISALPERSDNLDQNSNRKELSVIIKVTRIYKQKLTMLVLNIRGPERGNLGIIGYSF